MRKISKKYHDCLTELKCQVDAYYSLQSADNLNEISFPLAILGKVYLFRSEVE